MRISVRLATAVLVAASLFTTAQAADTKIGVVNVNSLLAQLPQVEQIGETLQKEFADDRRELDELQADLEYDLEKLKRDGLTMTEGQKEQLKKTILEKRSSFETKAKRGQEAFNNRRAQLFGAIEKRISEVINKKAKKEGYDLIVGEGVIYASDQIDITESVLKQLKKEL